MSWFAVSEEDSAERRPTNNGRDPALVGETLSNRRKRRFDHSSQRSLPKIITLCYPDPEFLRGRGTPHRALTLKEACVSARRLARSLGPSRTGMCARDDSKKKTTPTATLPRLSVYQFRELAEKVTCIVRSGRGLGMILHTKNRDFLVTHSLDRTVVQVDVRHFDLFRQ